MLSSFVTAVALAASISNVAAGPIRHASRGYAQDADILEDYTPYHIRYLALGCSGGHGSPFFEKCCHPLLRWQKLEDRPAECIPSPSASSSAVLAEPTASPIDEDPVPDYDDDCSEDEPTSAAPAPSPAPVTSSTYIAPEPTTPKPEPTSTSQPSSTKEPEPEPTKEPEPEPTTTKKPEPTKEPEPEPTSTKTTKSAEPEPTQGSGGGEVIEGGFATFFTQNNNAGACGDVHGDYDKVVALDYRRYGPLNQKSEHCGKFVQITNINNGKSVRAKVADACPSCVNGNCLDLSLGTFNAIAAESEGMVPIKWTFV
ncbi:rare lipoprotein A (RlpA)-like double-psi beta-barrel domain-containing protein [Rhizoctonia solani AG-1 IA]|uniref:Rare lipoprotein A (RlpA)-like double-psi beta-barrel domain-containing protein n=1 Tax=Thanatephorus cucumeris (strain AG1-IA) TaxID=983506 RepID=L8X6U4_THACA|nr:rare lipoprotein A (RlpA)-like double-psi beta-barrel domain-containing protein [Rhizoctonia solani AG-1 IA]